MNEKLQKVTHVSFQHPQFQSYVSRHKFEQVSSSCSVNGSVNDAKKKKNLVSVWFNIQHLDAHSETAHVYFHTQGGVDSESCSINQTIYEIYKSDFLQWVQKKLGQNYLNQQQKTWLTL